MELIPINEGRINIKINAKDNVPDDIYKLKKLTGMTKNDITYFKKETIALRNRYSNYMYGDHI